MFDFSPVGGIVALVGIIFMSIFGWRLVKPRKTSAGLTLFEIEPYLFEVKISQSKLKEKTIKELEKILDSFDINLTTLIHNKNHYNNPSEKHILQASDLLIIESSHEELDKFIAKYKLSLLSADNKNKGISHSPETIMSEVVITPNSNLENRLVRNLHFKNKHGINLLAISREGKSQTGRLKDVKLQIGDVLLLHGDQDNIDNALEKFDCLPLAARGVDFGKRKYGNLALAIFATTIALATFNILPIQVSLGLGVILMVVFNIIPTRELYDGVDWPVIILLGAMIPVGGALETTGTTKIIADNLLNLTQGLSIVFILAAVFIITMTLSDILNNAATAILMAPIGKTIAESAGVNTDPFLMAIAIGASCAFLTPIGHQNNALVMGPGGYKFSDYWKIGLPLEILITATAIPLILVFWPL
jgi:di/tricarboxylate transporter